MPVANPSTVTGCTEALRMKALGVAQAGQEFARILRAGGSVPTTYTVQGERFDVELLNDAGIVADDSTDVNAALQSAIQALTGGARRVLAVLPPAAQPYVNSASVTWGGNGVVLCGYGARVRHTSQSSTRFTMTGVGNGTVGLRSDGTVEQQSRWFERWRDLGFSSGGTTVPGKNNAGTVDIGDAGAHYGVYGGTSDCFLVDCHAVGGRGVFRCSAASGVVSDIYVGRCKAVATVSDGFHFVRGASDITIEDCAGRYTGDDFISFVSYDMSQPQNGSPNNFIVRRNVLVGSRARGLTCIGGTNGIFEDNDISLTLTSGIRVFSGSGEQQANVSNITIRNNRIDRTSLNCASNARGAVNIYADGVGSANGAGFVDGVLVENNVFYSDPDGTEPLLPTHFGVLADGSSFMTNFERPAGSDGTLGGVTVAYAQVL